MRINSILIVCFAVLGVSHLTARAAAPAVPTAASAGPAAPIARVQEFDRAVRPLLQKYCYECHGDGSSAGDLDLDQFKSHADVVAARATWAKVIRYARTHVMPPPEADVQPTQEERDALVAAFQRQLFDPSKPDPGRVTIRRLNRAEYKNTVRDLLGVGFDPTIDFPQDDTGYGFDNIADVLTLPPMLMEKYLAAAERLLDEAVPTERVEQVERRVTAVEASATFRKREDRSRDGWVNLSSKLEDALSVTQDAPAPGEYVLRVLAYAKYPGAPPEGKTDHPPLRMSVMLGDVVAREVEVNADRGDPRWYEARIGVPAGRQQFRVALRRLRGLKEDANVSDGRVGLEQPGELHVKEIHLVGPVSGAVRRVTADRLELSGAAASRTDRGSVALHRTDDTATARIAVPADGKYLLRAQAYAEYAGDEHAKMQLLLDGEPLEVFDVAAPAAWRSVGGKELGSRSRRAVPRVYEVRAELKAGQRKLAARFVNNFKDDAHADPNYRDRNLFVQHFEVVELSAPPLSAPMSEPMRRLFAKHAAAGKDAAAAPQARALLGDFARRAWRRPVQRDELDRLMKLYDLAHANGEGFQGGVKHAMKAILVSPSFLFRGGVEADADERPHPVDQFELASRLSYFLWSTTPDDELLDLAERGELRQNLDAQVKRMLASNKAGAFVDNFAGQWLQFRNLDAVHPDRKMFEKQYDDRLRDAMQRETELFFESILKNDRSLLDVLTADYTFVNERLAAHYGIEGVSGDQFRRVSLKGTPRRGVLTHGSVLTLTSNPTRTSPVKRGKWVLQNLLGTEPPPPPPDTPPLEQEGKELTGTIRQKLEQHRADPGCASCHAPMDPIGFGLENFDAIGRWRDKDGKLPIDPSSEFGNGAKFSGAVELTELLAKTRRNDFFRAVAENALTFALGRGVEPYDQPAVDAIVDELRKNDGRISSLIAGVVHSVPFQMRRGSGNENADESVTRLDSAGASHE